MRFDLDKVFGVHEQAMVVRSRRAELLASNLANADTPNYKARDIDFKQVLNQAQSEHHNSGALRTTHPNHIQSGLQVAGLNIDVQYRTPLQASLDGNTVDSQVEKSEFIRNAVQYQVSTSFLSGKIKSILTALKGE